MSDPRAALVAASRRFESLSTEQEMARQDLIEAIVHALREGVGPAEVQRLSPFTSAYIRKLARDNDVPPAALGRKPQKRT